MHRFWFDHFCHYFWFSNISSASLRTALVICSVISNISKTYAKFNNMLRFRASCSEFNNIVGNRIHMSFRISLAVISLLRSLSVPDICNCMALWCQTSFISNTLAFHSNRRTNERWRRCFSFPKYSADVWYIWIMLCQHSGCHRSLFLLWEAYLHGHIVTGKCYCRLIWVCEVLRLHYNICKYIQSTSTIPLWNIKHRVNPTFFHSIVLWPHEYMVSCC